MAGAEKLLRQKPSPTVVRQLLGYHRDTGILTWLVKQGPKTPGSVAGTLGKKGYIKVQVCGALVQAHILAWVIITGEWPDQQLDHRDGVRSNNRWDNLRLATGAQQRFNQKTRADSRSGLKGVQRRCNRWIARITVGGKRIDLGRFDTAEEAHAAYVVAAAHHFGEFARAA